MLFQSIFTLVAGVILCTTPLAWALSLTVGVPTECDDLHMTWTGGTAPFVLFMTPVFGSFRVANISSSSINNGQGSFQMQVPFPVKQKMLVSLFDSDGASVTTDILIVGNSLGGSCNTTDPGVDFSFELNTALQQCRPYTFSGYSGAVLPVQILGLIPLGQAFILQPSSQATSYDWVSADVAAGTSIVFAMIDNAGRNGGSSDIKQVGSADDSSCLNNLSPSSTATSGATSTSSTPSSTGALPPSSSGSPSHGLSTGVIIGAAGGGLILIAVLGGIVLFFLRRQDAARHARSDIDLSYETTGAASNVYPYPISSSAHLTYPASPPPPPHSPSLHYVPPAQYEAMPFILPPSQAESSTYPRSRHSMTNSHSDLLSPEFGEQRDQSGSSSSTMSSSQRKAALAGAVPHKPSRFIVHTDVEEAPHEEEVIELPPQYSDNRMPLQLVNPHDHASPPPTRPSDHSSF